MKMKLYLTMILLIASCSNPKETADNKSKEIEKPSEELIEMFMKDYNDAAELFSIKYNISQKNAKIIINEYIRIYDPVLNSIITGKEDDRIGEKLLNPDESLRDFIFRMNQITGEESVKISSFVIDLKIYMKLINYAP
ncbi:MAG TPA: hypothetical protein PKG96_10770 [Bacilli bacterium]|jgi:hypothetical protein|nr:hypothetical protein [Bacilli bacterium]HOO15091.1 hypothetical protein [Candidatus Neomarinimicrobiota bacterium]